MRASWYTLGLLRRPRAQRKQAALKLAAEKAASEAAAAEEKAGHGRSDGDAVRRPLCMPLWPQPRPDLGTRRQLTSLLTMSGIHAPCHLYLSISYQYYRFAIKHPFATMRVKRASSCPTSKFTERADSDTHHIMTIIRKLLVRHARPRVNHAVARPASTGVSRVSTVPTTRTVPPQLPVEPPVRP
jgi:hypothetical protein